MSSLSKNADPWLSRHPESFRLSTSGPIKPVPGKIPEQCMSGGTDSVPASTTGGSEGGYTGPSPAPGGPLIPSQEIRYRCIGHVESSFREKAPPKEMRNSRMRLHIDEEYLEALEGVDGFRHLMVIYHMDRSPSYQEKVHPMGNPSLPLRGVLATRSPARPNPIGVTVVELISVRDCTLEVTGLDALDGTPILDIKPYQEHFDSPIGVQLERDPNYDPMEKS